MTNLQTAIEETARVLGIRKPEAGAPTEALRAWVEWWKPSVDAARDMSCEQIAHLRANGWWPPKTASQISTVPPPIVRRTIRPALDEDDSFTA